MATFDPTNVDLTSEDVNTTAITCFLQLGENEYDGKLRARISAVFVILVVSTAATFLPVVAARVPKFRVPLLVYLFARYFGAGVILATAFIHLLSPAYEEIGPASCVGMTGGWVNYDFCAGLVLLSVTIVFLMDFGAERYVEAKYGFSPTTPDVAGFITTGGNHTVHQNLQSSDQNEPVSNGTSGNNDLNNEKALESQASSINELDEFQLRQQIAAFLILEFGIIFHSVIIGLNLGTVGDEFTTLYPVLVFHQSFEGLGIGARLSAIPMPKRYSWLPWALCSAYGLTTPIAIAVGLGIRTTYNSASYTAYVVSGVLDSISAGILIYTALVELLARDFLFNPQRTKNNKQLGFMVGCVMLGGAIMALLGKWA